MEKHHFQKSCKNEFNCFAENTKIYISFLIELKTAEVKIDKKDIRYYIKFIHSVTFLWSSLSNVCQLFFLKSVMKKCNNFKVFPEYEKV